VSLYPDRSTIGHLLAGAGVDAWGVARVRPSWPAAPDLPTAVTVTMRVRDQALREVEHGPTPAYLEEYGRLNHALDAAVTRLAAALHASGFQARAVPATVDSVDGLDGAALFPHKTAATQAGLGWIGKTGLFVSQEFGPAVRLATVFTDLDLPAGTPLARGECGACRHCVDACPAAAGRDVTWEAGMPLARIFDAEQCRRHMAHAHAPGYRDVCGICLAVCPRSHARRPA
jgi:epoxyqueuosine reductase